MAEPHASPDGAVIDLVRQLAPYAPGFAGAVFSMAFGERLTIRGKLLSAAVGLACAWILAPFVVDVLALWKPSLGSLKSLGTVVGFTCGVFGMILLSGLAQALAKYSKDPLSLVRVKIGGATFGGRPADAGDAA